MDTPDHDRRFPLAWPAGWPRTKNRRRSNFKARSFAEARDELLRELHRLGARRSVLSTNLDLDLRLDGLPRAGQRNPSDPGVAVYFERSSGQVMRPYALACDHWDRVEDNAYALAKHIEAMRGQERWGVGSLEQAFAGYAQLPPARKWEHWRGVFGDWRGPNALELVEKKYREIIKEMRRTHPAGDHPDEAELDALRDEATKELS